MLKKITKAILILFLVSLVFISNSSYAICNTIRAEKTISAVKLTLSDGQVLYNFKVKSSDINKVRLNPSQVYNAKYLDLIFLIDTKTSNLNAEKNIVKTAINSFKEYYSRDLSKLSIGMIGFNNTTMQDSEFQNITLELKNYKEKEADINAEIEKLKDDKNKGMNIEQATTIANKQLGVYTPESNRQQVVIIISDGIGNADDAICKNANNQLKDMLEVKMSLVYALISNEISNKDGLDDVLDGMSNFISKYSWNDLPGTVKTSGVVYNEIINNLLISNKLILDADAKNILVSDKVFLFLDPEIAHGAKLEIEYTITVQALNGLSSYKIQEDLTNNNLKFSKNGKLLTENRTNEDQGWRYEGGVPVVSGSGGSSVSKKIVLSTVISAQDFSYTYKNQAICQMGSVGAGESTATNYTRTVISPEVSIIPPFGSENTNKIEFSKYIPIIITIIGTFAIIVLITKKKK